MVELLPLTARVGDSDGGKSHELSQLLQDPRAYSDRTTSVEVVETHISWVFLTDRFAYKLKKPKALPFVDFRALRPRKFYLGEELRLNRRTANDQQHQSGLSGQSRLLWPAGQLYQR